MRKLLTAVCLLGYIFCYSQNPTLDTLKSRLSSAATSKEKVDLLGKLARSYMMNMGSSKIKSWAVNTFVKDWKKHRAALDFPDRSFNQLWKERKKDR